MLCREDSVSASFAMGGSVAGYEPLRKIGGRAAARRQPCFTLLEFEAALPMWSWGLS